MRSLKLDSVDVDSSGIEVRSFVYNSILKQIRF